MHNQQLMMSLQTSYPPQSINVSRNHCYDGTTDSSDRMTETTSNTVASAVASPSMAQPEKKKHRPVVQFDLSQTRYFPDSVLLQEDRRRLFWYSSDELQFFSQRHLCGSSLKRLLQQERRSISNSNHEQQRIVVPWARLMVDVYTNASKKNQNDDEVVLAGTEKKQQKEQTNKEQPSYHGFLEFYVAGDNKFGTDDDSKEESLFGLEPFVVAALTKRELDKRRRDILAVTKYYKNGVQDLSCNCPLRICYCQHHETDEIAEAIRICSEEYSFSARELALWIGMAHAAAVAAMDQ